MSVTGQIHVKGSTVTIRRAVSSRTLGGATNLAWADVATGVKMLLDVPDPRIVQRVFGQEKHVELMAFALPGQDVTEKDGIVVTAGWKAGERFHVDQVVPSDRGRPLRHVEVALTSAPAGSFS